MKINGHDVPTAIPLFGEKARLIESALAAVDIAADSGASNKELRIALGVFVHDYFAIVGIPPDVAEGIVDEQAAALYRAVQSPFAD